MDTMTGVVVANIGQGSLRVTPTVVGMRVVLSVPVSTMDTVADAADNGWVHYPIAERKMRVASDPYVEGVAWLVGLGWEVVEGAVWHHGMLGDTISVRKVGA
jgi:hypothetical protein